MRVQSSCTHLLDDPLPIHMEEEEEEEVILLVELSGLPTPDMIKSCTGTCALLGLESSEPILQLDNYIFQGAYEESIGTAMVFREEGKELKYLCKTDKKLVMKRVVLKSKQSLPFPPTSQTSEQSLLTSHHSALPTPEHSEQSLLISPTLEQPEEFPTPKRPEESSTSRTPELSLLGPPTPELSLPGPPMPQHSLPVPTTPKLSLPGPPTTQHSLPGPPTPQHSLLSPTTPKEPLSVPQALEKSLPSPNQSEPVPSTSHTPEQSLPAPPTEQSPGSPTPEQSLLDFRVFGTPYTKAACGGPEQPAAVPQPSTVPPTPEQPAAVPPTPEQPAEVPPTQEQPVTVPPTPEHLPAPLKRCTPTPAT